MTHCNQVLNTWNRENRLELPSDFEFDKFNITRTIINEYGAKSTMGDLDKSALADYIVNLPLRDFHQY